MRNSADNAPAKEVSQMHATALALTLPSLTSNHRQDLLKENPLLSLYELFTTIPYNNYLQQLYRF
jgi:hypothetical protein